MRCPHEDQCPGCPLIRASAGEARAAKERRLGAALSFYSALAEVRTEGLVAPPSDVGYRTRAKLAVGAGAIGLFAEGTHRIVDLPGCLVLEPVVARVVASLREIARERPAELAGLAGPELRAVDVRAISPEQGAPRALVTMVLGGEPRDLAAEGARLLARIPEAIGVAVSFHAGGPQLLGAAPVLLAGEGAARDAVGRAALWAVPGSFVQANRETTGRIQDALLSLLAIPGSSQGRTRVLDVFGGAGTWSLPLAERGDVTLIESFAPAVEQASRAARDAGVEIRAIAGDAAEALRELGARGERFDLVIVNPPRRGVSPEARRSIARLAPRRIAYVSCEPQTLARDLSHLKRLGYRPLVLQPFDMMPLTREVETLAVLERGAEAAAPEGRSFDKPPYEEAPGWTAGGPLAEDESGLVALGSARLESMFVALVEGVTRARGSMDRGRASYRRLEVLRGHSLVEATAGSSAGLRRALARIGHPVLGDERLGRSATNRHFRERWWLDRAALHRTRLGAETSPIAADFAALLARLRGGLW